jgi:hypothetical protein
MSIRLQVLLEPAELRDIQRAARRRGMTMSEWVRQALRAARRAEPGRDPARKLAAIATAGRHGFPTADIDQMLVEIERGRADEA